MATVQSDGATSVTATSTKNNSGAAKHIGSSSSVLVNRSVDSPDNGVFASTVIDGDNTDEALSASTIAFNNQRPVGMRVSTTISGQSNTALQGGANVPAHAQSINRRQAYKYSKVATAYRNGYWDNFAGEFQLKGSYSRSGTTVTVTAPSHGLTTGDFITVDYTSGDATDGRYAVTVTNVNVFTVTDGSSGSTTGNVTIKGPAYDTAGSWSVSGSAETIAADEAATPSRSVPGEFAYKLGQPVPVQADYAAKTG